MAYDHDGKHHGWFTDTIYSTADGAVITEGDGNYNATIIGNGSTLVVGNGNQFVTVSGTGDQITIGNSPLMSWISSTTGNVNVTAGDGNVAAGGRR
ncbi:MAG TPA: hypothetical protein VFN42_03675 [Acetobacteraceae bacterium]|nr:hypothetical protein [Acetobacteraceae bacterium]